MSGEGELKVTIRYGDVEAEFSGAPGDVYRQVVSFLEKVIPAYSLARKISYSMGLQEILEQLSGLLAYEEGEGLFFTQSLGEFPVSDAVLLLALRSHLEHGLGRRESPTVNLSELSRVLTKSEKTVSGRLTELVQRGMLRRLDRGDYTITQLGIRHVLEKYGQGEG